MLKGRIEMLELMRNFMKRDEDGASAVEYGLLVAGIAALIVLIVFAFGGIIKGRLQEHLRHGRQSAAGRRAAPPAPADLRSSGTAVGVDHLVRPLLFHHQLHPSQGAHHGTSTDEQAHLPSSTPAGRRHRALIVLIVFAFGGVVRDSLFTTSCTRIAGKPPARPAADTSCWLSPGQHGTQHRGPLPGPVRSIARFTSRARQARARTRS
jgi:pilus assembly protein Flp/PilA